ncbi:MAG: ATP-dependent Clp protease proteolytic subunit, partial [Rickettsia endosymbiont of Ixodes ricinus]|nr:ATP-dependent Clp protease proteolytic subunit [Rickettsia endosymbiont of Ixodes ricinus]
AIYDTMEYIKPKVVTPYIAQAWTEGTVLLCGGEIGMRYSLPHSRIMIHQPSGGYKGQATDIEIHAQETLKIKKLINGLYSKHTGQDIQYVEKSMERDNFMSPEEAKKFGLVDNIISSRDAMALLAK